MKIKLYLLILCLTVFAFSVNAQNSWEQQSCKLSFQINNAGFTVHGGFDQVKALVNFDEQNIEKSSVIADINTESIQTGNSLRDRHLREEGYFDVKKYTKIKAQSLSIRKISKTKYVGKFQLTIKSVTKEIEIPFDFTSSNGTATMQGNCSLNRIDFNVGSESWILSNEVKIDIKLELKKK
jgi:polyisoprenoid-binding protein YceI